MRLLLDANVLLDCLVHDASGQPRAGKAASDRLLNLCDSGEHHGLVAWHTLPIVAYYHGRQHPPSETGAMMDSLLEFLEVPTVGHRHAVQWRAHAVADFEDALQMVSALAGQADVLVTRNAADFTVSPIPVMAPEEFLAAYPWLCRPDELKGQALVCFVTLKSGVKATPELKNELRNHIGKKIGPVAKPAEVRFADMLPKTRSGKIMRRLLKQVASGMEIKGDTATLEDFIFIANRASSKE